LIRMRALGQMRYPNSAATPSSEPIRHHQSLCH
jgi:hypothetical protein